MTEKLVRNTIEKNDLIKKGDNIIVGLSGGPDSVCLFNILLDLKESYDLSLRAVHVNHMLRPGDAEKDQEYVETVCRKAGVICDVSVCNCIKEAKERGVTPEEAGRDLRYEAYYRAAKELIDKGAPAESIKIAVAQNKNDQAETLLMRIIRGTGVNGLSGIDYKRAGELGTTVIRPLLDIERKDIESYCMEKGLSPRLDHTNREPVYTRNKVRLELIPYIADNFNGNIVDALFRLSVSAREDGGYLMKQAQEAYKALKKGTDGVDVFTSTEKKVVLDREGLKKADPAIRRRVMLMAFYEIGLKQDISSAHLELADRVILSENASAEAHFPENYVLSVSYNRAVARLCEGEGAGGSVADLKLKSKVLTIDEYRALGKQKKRGAAAFDCGRVMGAVKNDIGRLEVRGRQQGDYFSPAGMKSGRKKVQDYFVDRKIPKENRDRFRLVAAEKEIIWIFDPFSDKYNEVSEKYKVNDCTKEVLWLEIVCEI